jgi:hypothetical protein
VCSGARDGMVPDLPRREGLSKWGTGKPEDTAATRDDARHGDPAESSAGVRRPPRRVNMHRVLIGTRRDRGVSAVPVRRARRVAVGRRDARNDPPLPTVDELVPNLEHQSGQPVLGHTATYCCR